MPFDFNTQPYHDDFDELKKFYKILYRPGFSVQAREMNQAQSILQNQISKLGKHLFKQGSVVIPGRVVIQAANSAVDYIDVKSSYNNINVSSFIQNLKGKTIKVSGEDSGVSAEVVAVKESDAEGGVLQNTILISYKTADGETGVFEDGAILSDDANNEFQLIDSDATGKGSIVTIEDGYYFVNGYVTLVERQTIILDEHSRTPSYKIGLNITEKTISSEDESSLFDNAQETDNFAAPGANRYHIELKLAKYALDAVTGDEFIEIARIRDGVIQTGAATDKTVYNILADELARRTKDESGSYTLKQFTVDVMEDRNNNRGDWVSGKKYLINDIVKSGGNTYVAKNNGTSGTNAPVHVPPSENKDDGGSEAVTWEYRKQPAYNRGARQDGEADSFALAADPGVAYVNGYEIRRLTREFIGYNDGENIVNHIPKAREIEESKDNSIPAIPGNFVVMKNLHSLPPIYDGTDNFARVKLYKTIGSSSGAEPSGDPIGTARVKFIEPVGQPTDTDSRFNIGLFDVKLNSGINLTRDLKYIHYDRGGATDHKNFSAEIFPLKTRISGSAKTSGSSKTINGIGTAFEDELKVGDYIEINGTVEKVDSITDQNTIIVQDNIDLSSKEGYVIDLLTARVDNGNNSLLFPAPNGYVESIDLAEMSYEIYEQFKPNKSGNTVTITTTNGTFGSNKSHYIAVDFESSGSIAEITDVSPNGTSCTLTFDSSVGNVNLLVIAPVTRKGTGNQKEKSLKTSTEQGYSAAETEIVLTKFDGVRLLSVLMKDGDGNYTIDVTQRYEFDGGDRPAFYDKARMRLRPGYAKPENDLEIKYEYYSHGDGDFFTVKSYPGLYENIPARERDSIDFRPCIDTNASDSDDGNDPASNGGSLTRIPTRARASITADYKYYLPRRDIICIREDGKVRLIKGTDALNPTYPQVPAGAMHLYNIDLNPYTASVSNDILVQAIDNRRYTMRDIGELEKRIENLEEVTALSLLESSAESLSIRDSDGLDRFKNGFIVDDFTSVFGAGDLSSPDYSAAIDSSEGMLRPIGITDSVAMEEKNTSDNQRSSSHYQRHQNSADESANIITLPIESHEVYIEQPQASRVEYINPFAIFTFIGGARLTPNRDEWTSIVDLGTAPGGAGGFSGEVESLSRTENVGGWGDAGGWNWGNVNWGEWNWGRWGGWSRWRWSGNRGTRTRTRTGTRTGTVTGTRSRTINTSTVVTGNRRELSENSDASLEPFIRNRNILVQLIALKPYTDLHVFFDNENVNEHCTPSTEIKYTAVSGEFDIKSAAGGNSSEAARRFNDNIQSSLNKGDVVTGGTSNATAVVTGKYKDENENTIINVVNVKGTFQSGETITGSISGATGTVSSVNKPSKITTQRNGNASFIFNIPNSEAQRFRIGERQLKIWDITTAKAGDEDDEKPSTSAITRYSAVKHLLDRQTFNTSRTEGETVVRSLMDEMTNFGAQGMSGNPDDDNNNNSREGGENGAEGGRDPIAQTFFVGSENKGEGGENGIFLTEIDLFFAAKDANVPATVQIRSVVNGYPGPVILASTTLQPEEIKLSTNTVTLPNGEVLPDYNTATTAKFSAPVYLPLGEYAIVLLAESQEHRVWISNTGDTVPGKQEVISEQPYVGTFFRSQTTSTWSADQNQDLKFTLRRAAFDVSSVGNLILANMDTDGEMLRNDSMQTTNGSNLVRIYRRNHGLVNGAIAVIGGITQSVNGIDKDSINGERVVSNVTQDSFTIECEDSSDNADNADSSGYYPGLEDVDSGQVTLKRCISYNVAMPVVANTNFANTITRFSLKTTSGQSVNGNETPFNIDGNWRPAAEGDMNFLAAPAIACNDATEEAKLSSNNSLELRCQMWGSADGFLSPIIDLTEASVKTMCNRINSPGQQTVNIEAIDKTEILKGDAAAFNFTADGKLSTTAAAGIAAFRQVDIGKHVVIENATTAANNGTYLVKNVVIDGSEADIECDASFDAESSVDATTISELESFRDSIAPEGSSTAAKYITRVINLENPSTYVKIKFALNLPSAADIKVLCRTGVDEDRIRDIPFTEVDVDGSIPTVELGNDEFTDVDFNLENTDAFTSFQVKIEMTSTSSSAVPRIQDLRIISCA